MFSKLFLNVTVLFITLLIARTYAESEENVEENDDDDEVEMPAVCTDIFDCSLFIFSIRKIEE